MVNSNPFRRRSIDLQQRGLAGVVDEQAVLAQPLAGISSARCPPAWTAGRSPAEQAGTILAALVLGQHLSASGIAGAAVLALAVIITIFGADRGAGLIPRPG